MIRRILALWHARNLEFVRDRSSFGWNIAFPVLLVLGMAVVFSGPERPEFKVGVIGDGAGHALLTLAAVDPIAVADPQQGAAKVARQQLDMLLDLRGEPRYWINSHSAKGALLERLLLAESAPPPARQTVQGAQIRYVDWLLPGILGMNMMFSAMYGVGYVIVRYRKNGYLKRLHATPVRAAEFLASQALSRLSIILVVTSGVFTATDLLLGFRMEGSYFDLFVLALVGALPLIALGLIIAARVPGEELAEGLLNVITWPMIILSGVWFSMDGANPALRTLAQIFPLTHLLEAARAIMLDGAGLAAILPQLLILLGMAALFLAIGALLFRWER